MPLGIGMPPKVLIRRTEMELQVRIQRCFASVDPVSTTTISSTAPDKLERQRSRAGDSFRTIKQAEIVGVRIVTAGVLSSPRQRKAQNEISAAAAALTAAGGHRHELLAVDHVHRW